MPITVRTASVTLGSTLLRNGAPCRLPLRHSSTDFCTRSAGTAAAMMAPGRLLALFGMAGTHRLVGATLLNAVLRRSTCQSLKTAANASVPWVPMTEPYGRLIRAIQPDLLRMGFIKIQESEHAMTFTDGTSKVDFTLTDRHYHPALTVYFITRQGEHFNVASLRDKLNSGPTRKQECAEFQALNEKYGLWDSATPQARKDEGFSAEVSLSLKQTITFLEKHQKALSELGSDDEFD